MKTDVDFSPTTAPAEHSQLHAPSPGSTRVLYKGKAVSPWMARPRMLSGAAVVIVIIGAAVAYGINYAHKAAQPTAAPPPVVTVAVAPAQIASVTHNLEVTGSVSAWDPLSVGSEITGLRIEKVNVEEGDRVKQGQVMAVLNSAVLQAQLDQARARLLSSQTNLKKSIQPNRFEDIQSLRAALSQARANTAEQEAMLAQAEANLSNAERNEKRFSDLSKQGAVSQADYESRQTTAAVAQAEVNHMRESVRAANFACRQAIERLGMAVVGGRQEDIEIARATVAENLATVKQLEAQVAQTNICAPADALVLKRDAHIGDITGAGKSLFTLMRASRLELRAQVPEADLHKIAVGQSVKLVSAATSVAATTGYVRDITPIVDSESRLGTVRIDIPTDSAVKPGMFLRGTVALGSSQALTVPSAAIFNRDSQVFLFVVSGSQARRRSVETVLTVGSAVEVVSGLKPGELVIVDGGGFLKDGDYVRVSR